MKRRRLLGAGVAGLAAGAFVALRRLRQARSGVGGRVRTAEEWIASRRHRLAGTAAGFRYRLAGRHPAPDVADDILADRLRSALGPLEKRLDLPRLHVMVEEGVALLHGAVGTSEEEAAIIAAAGDVPASGACGRTSTSGWAGATPGPREAERGPGSPRSGRGSWRRPERRGT